MFRLQEYVHDIGVGSITALASIATTIGFSALIFSGPLLPHLSFGIYYGLISIVVATVVFAWCGSFSFAVAGPDSRTVSVLAAMALVASERLSHLPIENQSATLVMVMIMSSFVCGLVLYIVGAAKLGRVVRFVPYSIIAGFLGASGWMLILGTLRLLAGESGEQALLLFIGSANGEILICLTVGIALVIKAVNSKLQSSLSMPIVLLAAAVMIHIIMLGMGMDMIEARDKHWLLPELGKLSWVLPLFSDLPLHTDWYAMLGLSGEIVALTIVCIMTLLMSVAAIELISNQDADTNRELKVCGISNIVTSFFGGMANTISLTRTVLHYRAGARHRFSLFVVAALSLLCIIFGIELVQYIPVPVLAGLILMLGSSLVYEWLFETFKKVTLFQWLEILFIQIIILKFGFVAGVVLGLVLACISFVVNFSRINLVRLNLSRSEYSSNVERSLPQTRRLSEEGRAIQIFWLQGYIFFGSANTLVSNIKSILKQESEFVRILILDFKQVLGIDASAVVSFHKLLHIIEREDLQLLFCNIPDQIQSQLDEDEFFKQVSFCHFFSDLDTALEWSEDLVLTEVTSLGKVHETAESWLTEELGSSEYFKQLENYMSLQEYQANDYLFHQGDESNAMYIVVSGRVTVLLEQDGKPDLRLRSFLGQTLVGEIGIYRKEKRSASVKIDKPAVVYTITRESLESMHREQPDLAIALHMFVVRVVSARVGFSNKEIAELSQI